LAQSDSGALAACIESALSSERARNMQVLPRPADAFLIAPDSVQHPFSLPARGCMGFLAVGRRHTQALSLAIYRSDGRIAAASAEPAVYAYLQTCGQAGERFIAHVRMSDGTGEVRLLPLWRARARLEGLEDAMAACRAIGMVRPLPIDVGPEPIGPPLHHSLKQLTQRLAKLGYQRRGEPLRGSLPTMRRDVRRLVLPGNRCYAFAALGDVDVGDIDLRVFGPEESPRLLAGEYERSRQAVVKMCAKQDSQVLMDVRMYDGGGAYLVQGYELSRPRIPVPAGVEGPTLIGLSEAERTFGSRGLGVRDTIWVLLPARGEQRVPLHMSADGCYGVALVPSRDQGRGDLDLGVTDQHGNLVAADMGPGNHPRVYVCPERDALHMLVARTPDLTRPSRALLIVASDVPDTSHADASQSSPQEDP
ncbi:MAG: hypothetical protein OXR73_32675, partial [Myxococcales bacterium]|nr:hypothetical protein [Myxococcales bacterium]